MKKNLRLTRQPPRLDHTSALRVNLALAIKSIQYLLLLHILNQILSQLKYTNSIIFNFSYHNVFILCLVDCQWSDWTSWSGCSVICGGGQQSRHRTKLERAQNGGQECIGSEDGQRDCNKDVCPSK